MKKLRLPLCMPCNLQFPMTQPESCMAREMASLQEHPAFDRQRIRLRQKAGIYIQLFGQIGRREDSRGIYTGLREAISAMFPACKMVNEEIVIRGIGSINSSSAVPMLCDGTEIRDLTAVNFHDECPSRFRKGATCMRCAATMASFWFARGVMRRKRNSTEDNFRLFRKRHLSGS